MYEYTNYLLWEPEDHLNSIPPSRSHGMVRIIYGRKASDAMKALNRFSGGE